MSLLVFSGCDMILGVLGLEKKKGDTPTTEEVQPAQPGTPTKGVAPATPSAPSTSPELLTASVNGKYYNLLRTIYVPSDRGSYGDFYEWGKWSGTSWKGHTNLPPGYWIYVYPNWYIWGNRK